MRVREVKCVRRKHLRFRIRATVWPPLKPRPEEARAARAVEPRSGRSRP